MKKSLLSLLSLLIVSPLSAQNPLVVPDTLSGTQFNLEIKDSSKVFSNGAVTSTMGINTNYFGPTLIFNQGDFIQLDVTNSITDTTTLHWHGLHVPAQADGGPHITIPPGTVWSPAFEVKDFAGTHWYHPHLHMKTAEHVTKGAAGFIIVRDPVEAALSLPRNYGVDDLPLAIQTRAFDANGQFVVETALDTMVLVNGTPNPFKVVPANVVRLRLLNAATERSFNFGFSNNMPFSVIASDGGLLSAPVTKTRLLLAPGERSEVLIDLTTMQGQSFYLMSYASQIPSGVYGATNPQGMGPNIITNYTLNPLNGSNFNLLRLDVTASNPNGVFSMISTLPPITAIPASSASKTRSFTFMPQVAGPTGSLIGPFVINMMPFDMMMINDTVILGDTEIWQLTNQTRISHPFHIHDVSFQILDINGAPPAPEFAGRKDVVMVPPMGGVVRFIAKFEDYADPVFPYMYHCHMLTHEDGGMMGQFLVIDTTTGIHENALAENMYSIFPNPVMAGDFITINASVEIEKVEMFDVSGRLLVAEALRINHTNRYRMSTHGMAAGIYQVKLYSGSNTETKLFVVLE